MFKLLSRGRVRRGKEVIILELVRKTSNYGYV